MALSFGETHGIKRKLISLKGQFQTTRWLHRLPGINLAAVEGIKVLPQVPRPFFVDSSNRGTGLC
jgi:hypothetical protein